MSEQETVRGKMIRLPVLGDIENTAKHLCQQEGWDKYEEENWLETLFDNGYRKYVVTENCVYLVTECKEFEYGDIFEAREVKDGEVDFILSYYNGGCSFDEAIEEAIKNMEERNESK